MAKLNWFSATNGLNTVDDPARLPFEEGLTDLAVAVNVQVPRSGRVNRRTGYVEKQAGNYHSLFCDGGDCLVMKDTALYQVAEDYTLKGLRTSLTEKRMGYVQAPDGRIFYGNGIENGYYLNGVSYAWPTDTYAGPDTSRAFQAAPLGTHFEVYNSRMCIAKDNVLWFSEPWQYGLFDKARGFLTFGSDIRMVRAVETGLFVSDGRKVYFYRGDKPKDFTETTVANYPAYEWTDAIEKVEGSEIGLDPGLCIMWTSPEGVCLGTSQGQFINLNKQKVIYPQNRQTGAGLLIGYHYIHNI